MTEVTLEQLKADLERVRAHANNQSLSVAVRHAARVVEKELLHAIREREREAKSGAIQAGQPVGHDETLKLCSPARRADVPEV